MILIEVSTEAGRKIGGIYTVLVTKSKQFVNNFGKNYYLVGMYDEKCDSDVKYSEPPKEFSQALKELKSEGIEVTYGTWVKGANAQVFLVNFRGLFNKTVNFNDQNNQQRTDTFLNYYKFLLWKHYSVDSLHDNSWDLSESVLWGIAAGKLIEKMLEILEKKDKQIVCQFHEWLTAPALLYLKMNNNKKAKTVFTTHATVLGRSMSSAGRDVYLEAVTKGHPVNPSEAYRYGVEAKYQLERACAHHTDVFTTVSETTATECEYILEKKPDIVTINGIDFESFESEVIRTSYKEYAKNEIKQFIESYFMPHYQIDMRKCKIVFISGRYEYINKGFDIYIEGLGKLNQMLKSQGWNGTLIAFIFAPSAVTGPRDAVIKNYLLLDKISEMLESFGIEDIYKNFGNTINAIEAIPSQKLKHELTSMKKGFVKEGETPILHSHKLQYGNDIILNECARVGLRNAEDDKVKIIFYPTYVGTTDGILNMDYYSVLFGTDIGVFPSRYEPFGYTPVEAGMMKNISITSDTSGFGKFIESKLGNCNNINHGIIVLKLFRKEKTEIINRFAGILNELLNLDERTFKKLQEDAYAITRLVDWSIMAKNYFKAYEMALKK